MELILHKRYQFAGKAQALLKRKLFVGVHGLDERPAELPPLGAPPGGGVPQPAPQAGRFGGRHAPLQGQFQGDCFPDMLIQSLLGQPASVFNACGAALGGPARFPFFRRGRQRVLFAGRQVIVQRQSGKGRQYGMQHLVQGQEEQRFGVRRIEFQLGPQSGKVAGSEGIRAGYYPGGINTESNFTAW